MMSSADDQLRRVRVAFAVYQVALLRSQVPAGFAGYDYLGAAEARWLEAWAQATKGIESGG